MFLDLIFPIITPNDFTMTLQLSLVSENVTEHGTGTISIPMLPFTQGELKYQKKEHGSSQKLQK